MLETCAWLQTHFVLEEARRIAGLYIALRYSSKAADPQDAQRFRQAVAEFKPKKSRTSD